MKRLRIFAALIFVALAMTATPAHAVLVCLQWTKGFQFFDANGNPLAAGTINIYDSGTTSLRTTYSDNGGTVANTLNGSNAIVLDSGGKLDESVYIPTGAWKFLLKDSGGSTIETADALLGCLDTSVFLTGSVTAETPVITKSADYSIVNGDQTKVVNANPTGGSFTLTLPSAVTVGDGWRVTIRNVGTANQVNIATVSAQTIDGQTSAALTTYLEALTLVSDGANWHVADTANPGIIARTYTTSGLGFSIVGGNIIASVSGNALTFAIKTAAGNDPTSFAPVKIVFRGQAAADEEYSVITLTAATSVVVPDTATLGTSSSTAFRIWIVGFNDGGTFRLGVINCLSGTDIYPLGQFPIASSTAVGTGSDSAHVFYTGSAVSSKPYQVLGYANWESGLGTAGTWSSTASHFQLFGPGVPLPGTIIQVAANYVRAATTGAVTIPFDNTVPQQATEGVEVFRKTITPTSAANMLHIDGAFNFTITTASSGSISLFRSTTAVYACGLNTAVALFCGLHPLSHKELAGSTSSSTFTVRAGNNAGNTLTFNGSGGTALYNGIISSRLSVYEIMT